MFDLILRGGRVLDGAGNSDFPADVAVEGGKIGAVGQLGAAEARDVVDVTGLTVAPGFIDVHCHSDALPFATEPLPAKVLQGVTTEVNGNCGSTRLPGQRQPRVGQQLLAHLVHVVVRHTCSDRWKVVTTAPCPWP